MTIQAGSYPEAGLLPLITGKKLTIQASGGPAEVGRVYTERLAQLSGDYDPENKPHINYTGSWGVRGVDLGANTEHCDPNGQNCKLYVFFGDVYHAWTQDGDLTAFTDSTNPEPNGFRLSPVMKDDGSSEFYAFSYYRDVGGGRVTVTTGTNETPVGAFSYDGKAFVFVLTGNKEPVSHLTVSEDPSQPKAFRELFELSYFVPPPPTPLSHPEYVGRDKFHQIAPWKVTNAEIPGLPAESGDGLIVFGKSGSGVYLAWMPLQPGRDPDKSEIRYYTGDPQMRWSSLQEQATPLFNTKWLWSSLSVGRIPEIGKWILLYQRTQSTDTIHDTDEAIVARLGTLPWEWSGNEIEVFNPYREGAFGRYMNRQGCPNPDGILTREFSNDGFAYGAYLLNRYTKYDAAERTATLYYLMSTNAPYQVQLMRSRIRIPQ